ncbi:hypothetical protein LINPERHAP1_LOCUS36935, partial [Linum perenne]
GINSPLKISVQRDWGENSSFSFSLSLKNARLNTQNYLPWRFLRPSSFSEPPFSLLFSKLSASINSKAEAFNYQLG